mmetsp:Transcript_11262/g.22476  ORF Transcript_11262/g.22476 Transcript_11262/m.22476 type:complete len:563 (-) Transcript_11262:313-2001(-)
MKFTSSCALSIALGVSSAINSSAFISSSLSPPKTTNHRVQQLIHAHALIDADANINIDTAELEKSSWIKAFNMVDKDNSGFIDKQELKACLTALGQPNSDDDISRLLSPVGITLTDELKIDQESFLSIVGAGIDEELDNNQVLQMYHAIDIDASGYITAAELQHFLGNLGMFLDDQTMSGLMNMYDDDGNGRITFGEFRDIVIDLGFAVSPVLQEDIGQVEQNDDVDTTEILSTRAHEDDTPENEGKLLSLSSITDEDLREALAPFDVDGSGTIDLLKVRDAAEGKGPAKLHYSDDRPMVGLADYVKSVNHVAILVSDVSRSLKFYSQVMGFEQIRRPNFDAYGAWLTMGNCELHLIKGKPIVPEGDDLVVGHISIDSDNVLGALDKLQKMNVPFRKNSSVPAGADAGSMNTNANDDMMSDKIVTQFFVRDPDGYYIEVCNCDETLTKYCLGEKDALPGYEEGVKPFSFATASVTISLMQRWVAKLDARRDQTKTLSEKVKKETDGSVEEIAKLLGYTPACEVDATILQTLKDRHSIYSDIWQNEEVDDIESVLVAAGNGKL